MSAITGTTAAPTMSRDLIGANKETIKEKLAAAFDAKDSEAASEAMLALAQEFSLQVRRDYAAAQAQADADRAVLAARGVRQLTSEEKKFYDAIISASASADPKQEISNIEVAMPRTTIDSVFEDMRQEHPLLEAIDFVNTNGAIKMIVNTGGVQLAVWGKLTSAYTKELEGSIDEIDTTLCKLTAYIPVPKDMLDLGPSWLDRYVRVILSEAVAFGLEKAIVTGSGKDEPVGIDKKVGKNAVTSGGVYEEKEAVEVNKFDTTTYGYLCSLLVTNSESGLARDIRNLVLIVNPVDKYHARRSPEDIREDNRPYENKKRQGG